MIIYPITFFDYLEIMLIAYTLYHISMWLQKDRCFPLLVYAYMYGFCCCIAYIAGLHVILLLIPYSTLIFCMVGIIMHKDALQKNLIAHKHINSAAKTQDPQWLEHMLSSALIHINNQKQCTILIEHTDDMSAFIHTPFILNTPTDKIFLDIIMNRYVFDGTHMIWLRSSGIIMSCKAQWKQQTSFDPDVQQEFALLHTHKTDAIVCFINQKERTCTLIISGNTIPHLTIYNACQLIRKHINVYNQSDIVQRNPYDVPPFHHI